MKRVATLRFSDIKEIRGMSFGNDGKSLVCFAPTTNPAQKTEGVTETAIMWWNLEKYTVRIFLSFIPESLAHCKYKNKWDYYKDFI